MFYSNVKYNYLPLQALIACSLTELNSFGYATDILPAFDRMIGIFFGIISSGIINHYIWPVNKSDLLQFRAALTLEAFAEVTAVASKNILKVSNAALFKLYLEVIKIKKLTFSDGFENSLYEPLRDLCYEISIIKAIMNNDGYKISAENQGYLNKVLSYLNNMCSGEKPNIQAQDFNKVLKARYQNSNDRLLEYYLIAISRSMLGLQKNLARVELIAKEGKNLNGEMYKPLSF